MNSRQICQQTWGIVTSRDWRASVSVIALTLLAASCGTPLTWWLSPTGRNHPLAETIWDVRADGFVTPSDLAAGRLFPAIRDLRRVTTRIAEAVVAQAAEVILTAITNSDGTRAGVTGQLFKTNVKNGILGSFKIDKNGDTTSNPVTIYKIKSGKSVEFKVIVPPVSLVKAA